MSNQNNVPVTSGWYYVGIGSLMEIARVVTIHDGVIFYELWGDGNMFKYPGPPEDTEVQWLGPVPMPGEWVPRSEYDEVVRNLDDRI